MGPRNIAAEAAAIDAAVEGKTLITLFDRNAETYGDKAAIHWKEGDLWRHLTWKQYRHAVHERIVEPALDTGDGLGRKLGPPWLTRSLVDVFAQDCQELALVVSHGALRGRGRLTRGFVTWCGTRRDGGGRRGHRPWVRGRCRLRQRRRG